MEKKKGWNRLSYLIILVLFISVLGISYAFWVINLQQSDKNVITSDCFEVKLMDATEGITLRKAYPMSDEDGKETPGYTLTIKNICKALAYYEVNLEEKSIEATERLDSSYLKVSVNNNQGKMMDAYANVNPTIEGYDQAYKLTIGSLQPNEEKTYNIKLWLEEHTPKDANIMNRKYYSKVSIIASYLSKESAQNTIEINSEEPTEYRKDKEVVTIHATSEKYDLIEYSYDNETFEELENPSKEVTLEKEETKEGTYEVYFKDEVGNIQEQQYETTKLDQTPPEIDYELNPKEHSILINLENSKDAKSGIKSYEYQMNEVWEEDQSQHTFQVDGYGVYQVNLKLTDEVGNVNEQTVQVGPIYQDEILNGVDPVLAPSLIPVTIDQHGKVHKANLYKEWYNYTNKQWANAVILENPAQTIEDEGEILESEIESYFVWIPKYRYQLWNVNHYPNITQIEDKVREIQIIFGDYNTTNTEGECSTPMTSGNIGSCQEGNYMTHPAFLSLPSTGFWMGKFETGYKDATKSSEAEANKEDTDQIIIKPKSYSWRRINVTYAHLNSFHYQRELDSHLVKNTEWGAVAYLANSKYGLCTNSVCKEVRVNNHEDYVTGYSAVNDPTCGHNCYDGVGTSEEVTQPYNTEIGYLASTTQNITGIYDLSGASWEYNFGLMKDQNGNLVSGPSASNSSEFNGVYSNEGGSKTTGYAFPDSQYYDVYNYTTSATNYENGILGDATSEMGPFGLFGVRYVSSWNHDMADFLHHLQPWFNRSEAKDMGSDCGIFAFDYASGEGYSTTSYRIILTPKKDKA